MRSFGLAVLFLFSLLIQASAQTTGALFDVRTSKTLMGTQVDLIILHSSAEKGQLAAFRAFKEIERIEALLSSHIDESEIARINAAAGKKPIQVSIETFAVLERAKSYSERFSGLFDLTIGPLVNLWGFSGDLQVQVPEKDKLRKALELVNFRYLVLDLQKRTALLRKPGMKIDLGGIAKGYAIDRAAMALKAAGVRNFLINAGGDIFASGRKANGEKWVVGVQHPRQPQKLLASCQMTDFAVATSGDYERYAELNGKRYHHLLNPKTGLPSRAFQSVTVFAASAEEADVWATYLFLQDQAAAQNPPAEAPSAVFIDSQGKLHSSDATRKQFVFTSLAGK